MYGLGFLFFTFRRFFTIIKQKKLTIQTRQRFLSETSHDCGDRSKVSGRNRARKITNT